MKKVLLFITMAASLLFAQCKKSEDSAPSEAKPVEMTVTVGPGSKTDIASTGGITWSAGDKLYVGYDRKYVGYLTLASGVGGVTGMFTGSVELTGVAEGNELTFHFYYLGSADHTNLAKNAESVEVDFSSQDITKDGNGKLTNASLQHVCYGSAKGTVIGGAVTDINVMMVSKVAIAHFNFKKGDADYKGALTLGGTNICNKMTVNFNSEVFACTGTKGDISLTNTTSSEKYVMLVPTAETTGSQIMTFAGKYVSGETTLENGIKPNKFYGLNGALEVTLKGVTFTVDGSGAKVEFAPGNLWYGKADGEETEAFHFETNQWNTEPTAVNQTGSSGTYSSTHVSHFYWSKSASVAYAELYSESGTTTSDEFFTNSSSFQVAGEAAETWRTLSQAEWDYLLKFRIKALSLRAWVTLTDVNVPGLVILPDGSTVTANEVDTKEEIESSGAVFLPAAGYRVGASMTNVGSSGYYWSSTTPNSLTDAYFLSFSSDNVEPKYFGSRGWGRSVRLVRAAL